MNWEQLARELLPGVTRLALAALSAIVSGDYEKAARKAEEAARRQAVKLAANAAMRARK